MPSIFKLVQDSSVSKANHIFWEHWTTVKQAETQSWDEKPGLLGVAHAGQMLGKELLALPQAAYPAQDTRCRFGWFFTGYPTVKGKAAHVRIIQLQSPPWKRCSYLT